MGIGRPGDRNPNWRGGRVTKSDGYVLLRVGADHPLADVRGYAYEHRVVAEQKIGRPLVKGEQVHHIDGNRQNNSPENLEVLTVAEHRFEHRKSPASVLRLPSEPNPEVACECGCGSMFSRYDSVGRPRRFVPGHNPARPRKYHDAIVGALSDGTKTRAQIAAAAGADPDVMTTILSRLAKTGAVVQMARGLWALPARRVDISLEIARAVADCLLTAGVRLDSVNVSAVVAALREVADQYESQASTGRAA